MCARCEAIDVKVEHYRKMSSFILDRPTLDSINVLIVAMEAEKKGLHPDVECLMNANK
jgi:hypothetical protein